MDQSKLDSILWAMTFIGNVALFAVLIFRGRWKVFPAFTAWIGFLALRTTVLYWIYRHGSQLLYARVYWSAAVVDFVLQLGFVVEMTRIVLRPTGTWVRDARGLFLMLGGAGIAVAALLAWAVSPPGLNTAQALEVRGSLFASLVTCELVIFMSFSANRLGLGWRNHVMGLAQGLGLWLLVAVAVDGIQSYFGAAESFSTLDHLRIAVYCVALGYWIVQFWRPEPARKPISAELQQHILALHRRVTYDLDRLEPHP